MPFMLMVERVLVKPDVTRSTAGMASLTPVQLLPKLLMYCRTKSTATLHGVMSPLSSCRSCHRCSPNFTPTPSAAITAVCTTWLLIAFIFRSAAWSFAFCASSSAALLSASGWSL